MSEPTRTTPDQRDKLAAALKRNMARRKSMAKRETPKSPAADALGLRSAAREPQSGGVSEAKGQRAPSIAKGIPA